MHPTMTKRSRGRRYGGAVGADDEELADPIEATGLRLRPLRGSDEAAVVAAHREMADSDEFTLGLGYSVGMPWGDYLRALEDQRLGIVGDTGLVPATFLVADVGGTIVGRTSIRHELNDFLAWEGGHIGYGVLVEHRGRGYASDILRQSLVIARAVGVDRVLLVCDDDNGTSARVIERCGGALDSVVTRNEDGRLVRRYWID